VTNRDPDKAARLGQVSRPLLALFRIDKTHQLEYPRADTNIHQYVTIWDLFLSQDVAQYPLYRLHENPHAQAETDKPIT